VKVSKNPGYITWLLLVTIIGLSALVVSLVFGITNKENIESVQAETIILTENIESVQNETIILSEAIEDIQNETMTLTENIESVQDEITINVPIGGSLIDAILELPKYPTTKCTIQLPPGTIDLGTDPMLNFFPGVRNCERIVVRGTRENTITDTVAGIGDHGPFDSWKSANGTTGGYTPSAYAKQFIHNMDQDRVYVVKDNTNSNIESLTGDPSTDVITSDFERPHRPFGVSSHETRDNGWHIGETFQLYTLGTVLTYDGAAEMNIPFGMIEFEDLHFNGAVNSTVQLPEGTPHRVQFRGCRLDSAVEIVTGEEKASFSGSMFILGCHIRGLVNRTFFNGYKRGDCVSSESTYMDRSSVVHMSNCYSLFTYIFDAPNSNNVFDADFFGYGIMIEEAQGEACYWFNSCKIHIIHLECVRTVKNGYGYGLHHDTSTNGYIRNLKIHLDGPTYENIPSWQGVGIYAEENTHVFLGGYVDITANTCLLLNWGSSIIVKFPSGLPITHTNRFIAKDYLAFLQWGAKVRFISSVTYTYAFESETDGFILTDNSDLTLPQHMTVNTTNTFVTLQSGSSAQSFHSNASFVNLGGGAAVQVGGNPAGPWFTQNDLNAATPQNTFFYTT